MTGPASAGQFEDGVEALQRGDQLTAARLLGPLAEKGDTRAQLALGVGPAVKGYKPSSATSISATQIEFILIAGILAICGIVYKVKINQLNRRTARIAEFISQHPEAVAEAQEAMQLAGERPWQPITFEFDSVERGERGIRLHASGQHLEHRFSFTLALTMSYGPVAVCEWSRDGAASDGLIDVLAHYADQPRGGRRFDDLVKTGALIQRAEPPNVPFADVNHLRCKIFFELADDNPEIYLDLDFAGKTGVIREKDPMYRKSLVHAFEAGEQRQP
jgi:hypothetical protein